MNVAEAQKNFAKLIDRVFSEGIIVDLERDNKVIARLTPAEPRSMLTVGQLNAFLRGHDLKLQVDYSHLRTRGVVAAGGVYSPDSHRVRASVQVMF